VNGFAPYVFIEMFLMMERIGNGRLGGGLESHCGEAYAEKMNTNG
jgi:hypothetical protein